MIFCLFEEPGCSLHRPRSSEEHEKGLPHVPWSWSQTEPNIKITKAVVWRLGWSPFAKMGYPTKHSHSILAFFLPSWHSKSSRLLLCFFIESPFSSSLFSTLSWNIWDHSITLPLPNLIISLGAFFGTPFSWFNLPCGECTEIMMPTQPCICALLW